MKHGLRILNKAKGRNFTAYYCEEEIVVIETGTSSEIEVEDIKEMLSLIGKMVEKGKTKNLIIPGKYSELNTESQKFMKTKEANVNEPKAEAIVIHSLAQRIVGNFYLKIISQQRPSKLFTSVDKAIDWLKKVN